MKEPAQSIRIEPRWPGALAVVAVLLLVSILPGRISEYIDSNRKGRIMDMKMPTIVVVASRAINILGS